MLITPDHLLFFVCGNGFLDYLVHHFPGCDGFGWGRVNFPHCSRYEAMFEIFAGNSVDKYRDVFVTAEQSLHGIKDFCASHIALLASRLGVYKKLEGTHAGQLTRTDQRDILYHMTSCSTYKAGE